MGWSQGGLLEPAPLNRFVQLCVVEHSWTLFGSSAPAKVLAVVEKKEEELPNINSTSIRQEGGRALDSLMLLAVKYYCQLQEAARGVAFSNRWSSIGVKNLKSRLVAMQWGSTTRSNEEVWLKEEGEGNDKWHKDDGRNGVGHNRGET
jgi:hypothetical protein